MTCTVAAVSFVFVARASIRRVDTNNSICFKNFLNSKVVKSVSNAARMDAKVVQQNQDSNHQNQMRDWFAVVYSLRTYSTKGIDTNFRNDNEDPAFDANSNNASPDSDIYFK